MEVHVIERLGRYQVRELVGEGAMASVYKAYDPDINRTIAVKLLKAQLRDDDEYRARFLREAKGAGVLSHPNIVTVFDVGEAERHPYIAMELVEGPTLADYVRAQKTLSTAEIVAIGIELARALDYAHRKGIIHRDVKPGNIMLSGERHTVKVADFGICRIDDSDATQQTQVGGVLGTPHYMSPEQVVGQKVDARSDLFSAGVVLYQLLTGTLPFEGDTLISVAYKITKSDPIPLDKVRPDLPHSLRRIIERALKKQPEKRFQTGEEFAQALEGVAAELAQDGDSKGHRVSIGVRWAVIMAAIVAVTMSVTAMVLYRQQYNAMMEQVKGYGGSLAKFTAAQSAVPLLGEDWAAIEVFVQETVVGQDFANIAVVDHDGVVRGSKDPALMNTQYKLEGATPVPSSDPTVKVSSYELKDGRKVLDFMTPVLFQNKDIGTVHLGLFEAPLTSVANLMLVLLAILTAVTTAAVALGSYLLARRMSGALRVLGNSLRELGRGRYDYRIAEMRNDEFGEIYKTFDATAAALEARHDGAAAAAAVGGVGTLGDGSARSDARRRVLTRAARRAHAFARMSRLVAVLFAIALIAGCATAPPVVQPPEPAPVVALPVPPARGPLLARDDDFAIVRVVEGDTLASLAQRYLGDAGQAWRIADWNGIDRVKSGDTVVIPLRVRNAIGVEHDGYQTIPILCYHRFGPKASKLTVTRAAFEQQMDYLARNGYHVVTLGEVRAFLDGKQPLPRKSVAITIDDGYRSTYEIAFPVLRAHAFPATVFLYSDFVGASDALTWAQMKEMAASRLIEIQPHSKTHANLTLRLPDENDARYRERVRREVDAPIGVIRDRLEEASTVFAYPYGDVNETVTSELARAGVATGVTVTPGGNGFFANPYMLRRSMVFGNEDLAAFKAKLATFARVAGR